MDRVFKNILGDDNDLRKTWSELKAAGEVSEKRGRSAMVWLTQIPKSNVIEFRSSVGGYR